MCAFWRRHRVNTIQHNKGIMSTRRATWLAAILAIAGNALRAAEAVPIIVDTDCGGDDLMAIAFLLARRDVRIEAVTIANGVAHVRPGAENVLRLLELGGRADVPVYLGQEIPVHGHAAFPEAWRTGADAPLGPRHSAQRAPQQQSAADYLAESLRERSRPIRILALGPLTNLGEALERTPDCLRDIDVSIMGGAIYAPGNLGDGGYFQTDNKTAEWNFYVDPVAAKAVFTSGAKIRLVPLDATNQVHIDSALLKAFRSKARTPLGEYVTAILKQHRNEIREGIYYAWDPLAAVAMIEPGVVHESPLAVDVRQAPPEEGRTAEMAGYPPNASVALSANAEAFQETFLRAFTRAGSPSAAP
jgi:inosine-uridine nucleoside N-ribohydrolase